VICLTMTFLTEVTSNVATISTVLPSLLIISEQLGTDARLLLIPATLATSCAFMLPIATAPNAIVFGSGRITPGQMARYGILLNLVGIPLLTAAACWYIGPMLGIK
jgi:sodium-dependent dicarboxylate transporter 2/3/5